MCNSCKGIYHINIWTRVSRHHVISSTVIINALQKMYNIYYIGSYDFTLEVSSK